MQAPRLGRRRFKAEPLQVLLSEDAEHGSLRQLKPAAALARDAFRHTLLRRSKKVCLPCSLLQSKSRNGHAVLCNTEAQAYVFQVVIAH